MSPTEAMLILKERLSGSGGAWITGTGSGPESSAAVPGIGGCSGGVVAQPASSASSKMPSAAEDLVTEPYAQNVNLCSTQTTAQQVEFIEIVGRTDAHAVVSSVVDCHALNL